MRGLAQQRQLKISEDIENSRLVAQKSVISRGIICPALAPVATKGTYPSEWISALDLQTSCSPDPA